MRRSHHRRSGPDDSGSRLQTSGFTLMEILVAIFLMSMVMTALFTAFNAIFGVNEPLEKGAIVHDMAKNCMSLITADVMSVYTTQPPLWKKPDFDEDPDPYRVKGELVSVETETFPRLKFSSLNHISFGELRNQGIAEIVYYVTASQDRGFVLKRFDSLYPHEAFEERDLDPVICTHIRSLEIRYYDEGGEEYDHWDSETDEFGYATPTSLLIKMALGDPKNIYIFETRVAVPLCRKKS